MLKIEEAQLWKLGEETQIVKPSFLMRGTIQALPAPPPFAMYDVLLVAPLPRILAHLGDGRVRCNSHSVLQNHGMCMIVDSEI